MLLAVFGFVAGLGIGHAQGVKVPDIKEIMKRLNKGDSALMPVVKNELQSASPNWPEIQKQTKEYYSLASSLEKNTPPMGSKDSWLPLSRSYAAITQELDAAAQKKDKNSALAAHGKLKTTCMACHKAHRP
jgi:hypothetical protein